MGQSTRIGSIRHGWATPSRAGCAALMALLAACTGDVVNIGEGSEPQREPAPSYSRCVESPRLEGTVVVNDQAQLDALEGCETIAGDLYVQPLFYPDLLPLHALREVTGMLAFSEAPREDGEGQSAAEWQLMESTLADWIPTLEGLERLERLGSLTIRSASAADLEPLSGLRELTGEGILSLEPTAVRDLSPLAQLRGIRSLFVLGEQLESIADLELPEVMTALTLNGPRLAEVGQVSEVRRISEVLGISVTGLRDLSAFSALEEVPGFIAIVGNEVLETLDGLEHLVTAGEYLMIASNPVLWTVDALAALQTVSRLEIYENASLRRIPDFPELLLQELIIGNNPELEEIAEYTGERLRWGTTIDGVYYEIPIARTESDYLAYRHDGLRVFGNPKLRSYVLPKGWQSAKAVTIAANESLTDLDLNTLEAIDLLSIKGNPVLTSLALGELATVDLLSVQGNPLLPLELFDSVLTFERQMSSAPEPLPSCGNGECAP